MKIINKIFNKFFSILDNLLLVVFILFLVFIYKVEIPVPEVNNSLSPASFTREVVAENHFRVGNNWLKKNKFGVWEMYLEGAPYERGLIYGVLAKELIETQEVHFVNQLNQFVPSRFFQHFLQISYSYLIRS